MRNAAWGERRDPSLRRPAGVNHASETTSHLLELDLGAGLFELLLDVLGVGLGDAFLEVLGRALDQVLRLLEAEARDLADDLDDVDLVGAGFLEVDGELGLLLGRSGRSGRSGRRPASDGNRSSLDAPLVLEGLDEVCDLDDRQVREVVDDLVLVRSAMSFLRYRIELLILN